MTFYAIEGTTTPVVRADMYRRAFDVAVSALLIVATLPILLVILVASAVVLRTGPVFSQERVGRDGQPFRFVKVRTLPLTVPAYVDKYELEHHRIPRLCQLLRSLHLDELPQLYLVLVGRMSLVGPRPEMACLHEQMTPAFAAERTAVRPGCTGLWQVSENATGLILDAPEYDRFYLAHRSLRLDLWILYRTALKMIGLARPITLAAVPPWARPADADDLRTIDLRDDVRTIDLRARGGVDLTATDRLPEQIAVSAAGR